MQAQVQAAARMAETVERLVQSQAASQEQRENKSLAGALHKVLQPPEVWKPETREQEHATWQEFSFRLKAYLTALDEKYESDFNELEAHLSETITQEDMDDQVKKRGMVLYAVLSSLVAGRPQKVLKQVTPGHGFEAYRLLAEQSTPQLRARALALLQSVLQYTFSKQSSLTENLQRLDDLTREYERASNGKTIHDDILVGILLKNSPNQMRNWLLVNLDENTPYKKVREALKSWDVQTYRWADSISYYQKHQESTEGAVAMDVDRVAKGKAKGKHKGKAKGKGKDGKSKGKGGWNSQAQDGKGKGKGKDKGKGKGKTDSKGKAKGKGDHGEELCFYCHKPGHKQSACWKKQQDEGKTVRAVEQTDGGQSSVSTTTAGPSASQVRRIDLWDRASTCVIYDIGEDETEVQALEDEHVRMVHAEVYHMDQSDEDGNWTLCPELEMSSTEQDVRYEHHEDPTVDSSLGHTEFHIRTMNYGSESVEAILDSGSDVTVLPSSYQLKGQKVGSVPILRDAQGNQLKGTSQRKVELVFEASTGEKLKVRQLATVAESVRQPLISAGKFLKSGWTPGRDAAGHLYLQHDKDGYRIPIHYSGNSLAVNVEVRRVDAYVREICKVPKATSILEDVWYSINGVPAFRKETGNFVDGRKNYSADEFPYRTTMVLLSEEDKKGFRNDKWKPGEEIWDIVECSNQYCMEGEIPTAAIPELRGKATTTLTLLHLVPMNELEVIEMVGKKAFEDEGDKPRDGLGRPPEAQQDQGESPEQPEQLATVEPEQLVLQQPKEYTEITYGAEGNTITPESPLRVMRKACQFYGLPQSGSKSQCWQRLTNFLANAEIEAALDVAKQYQDDLIKHANPLPMPKDVTPAERERHELTHLPKADWCEACCATKSKEDVRKKAALKDDDQRTIIHMDFGYITGESPEGKDKAPYTAFLCAVDSQTKWTIAVPLPGKNKMNLKYVVRQLLNATAGNGDVCLIIRADQEPALKQIARTWQSSRAALKLKSEVQLVAVGQHQGLLAERYIQTLRRQTLCLTWELENKTGVKVEPGSILCAWAVRHAGWLLNRFRPSSSQGGMTPFELRFERRYQGKLVPFGSMVFARTLPAKPKGIAQFQRSVFLGKSEESDVNLVGTTGGTKVARTIRRCIDPFRAEGLLQVKGVPWDFSQEALAVKMSYSRTLPLPDRSVLYDEEAEAVKKAAKELPDTDEEEEDDLLKQLTELEKEAIPKTPENKPTPPQSPRLPLRAPLVEEQGRGHKRQAEDQEQQVQAGSEMDTSSAPKRKADEEALEEVERSPQRSRGDPTSPSSASLYPPAFAGQVGRVEQSGDCLVATIYEAGDEYLFGAEEEEEEYTKDFGEDKDELVQFYWNNEDLEHEPQVSPDELARLDEEAFQKEVDRLLEMGVLKKGKKSELTPEYKELSTTSVQDWRHRNGSWLRRSRLVAREYKWEDPTRQDLFSAATSSSQTKLLAALMMSEPGTTLWLWSLDVKDAFLQVPQKSPTYVKPPRGYGHLLQEDEVWVLERLLPGQRAGTREWGLFLQEALQDESYESFMLSPNLFVKKDKDGKMEGCLLAHVDDIQLLATKEEGERLVKNFKQKFNLTVQGPCGAGCEEDAVYFLKRRYEYNRDGLTVSMGNKYIEKLVELLGLQQKKPRTTPEPAYEEDVSPELEGEERQRFATAVGILLYISSDRPDAQHGIRELASSLTKPTKAKYRRLEHLVCYLKGTAGYSIRFTKTKPGVSTLIPEDHWFTHEPEDKEDLLEVMTDADWAGNKVTRKSVTACHFYYNGLLVHTLTRTQKAIALSSCESEYVALTTGASEGIFLRNCIKHLTGRQCRLVLRCDSSSARAFCQRQGVGRVRHISCGLLWLQNHIQEGDVEIKPIGTWRNTSDISTKIQTKKRLRVLLNLMGFVDTHQDYVPVGEVERAEDEQKALERRSIQRIQRGNVQGLTRAFRVFLAQATWEQGLAASRRLESCGTEAEEGPSNQMIWTIIGICVCIAVMAMAITLWRAWRRFYEEWNERTNWIEMHINMILTRADTAEPQMVQILRDGQQSRYDTAAILGGHEGINHHIEDRMETILQNTSAVVGALNALGTRMDIMREDLNTLMTAMRDARAEENSSDEPSEEGRVVRVTTNIPSLRAQLTQEALSQQRAGVPRITVESPSGPSEHTSNWDPGDREEEAYGDIAFLRREYQGILEYEAQHGAIVAEPQPDEEQDPQVPEPTEAPAGDMWDDPLFAATAMARARENPEPSISHREERNPEEEELRDER